MGLIRLLLAISVVLSHSGPLPVVGVVVTGSSAVQYFFVLSGFYMALVINKKYDHRSDFYWNRLSRIFSGYWVCLVPAIAIGIMTGNELYGEILRQDWDLASKGLLLFANTFILGSTFAMFSWPSPSGLALTSDFWGHDIKFYEFLYLPPAWSLPVEMLFYAIAPFVVRSMRRILIVGVAAIAVRLITYHYFGYGDPWFYRFPMSEMLLFMIGASAFHFMNCIVYFPQTWRKLIMVTLLTAFVFHSYIPLAMKWPVITAFAVSIALIFPLTKHSSLDKYLGEISYAVYLIHWPLIGLARSTSEGNIGALTVLMALAFAIPLHFLAAKLDAWIRARRSTPPFTKSQESALASQS